MSSSATTMVGKATSDFLIGPDWTMNIDICDSVNSNTWQAKDVIKALKKRLQHKNFRVQILALTLLETLVKNCGDYVHFQISEKDILHEMIKIVKKTTDRHLRDTILGLIESWKEAFGGPGGKYPQYYFAYEELSRLGIEFPHHPADVPPPVVPHVLRRDTQESYNATNTSPRRLGDVIATEMSTLSLANLDSMKNVVTLLADMLEAMDSTDDMVVKDDVVVDLANQCRSNQKKLMQQLSTSSIKGEEVLGRGLQLNDDLQSVLAKYERSISGSPNPVQIRETTSSLTTDPKLSRRDGPIAEATEAIAETKPEPEPEPDEDEYDDFAQLARRNSKTPMVQSPGSNSSSILPNRVGSDGNEDVNRDITDLLSITLSEAPSSPKHNPDPYGGAQTGYVASWYKPPPVAAFPGRDASRGMSQPPQLAAAHPPTGGGFVDKRPAFVPPNKLFDDLNVMGKADQRKVSGGGVNRRM